MARYSVNLLRKLLTRLRVYRSSGLGSSAACVGMTDAGRLGFGTACGAPGSRWGGGYLAGRLLVPHGYAVAAIQDSAIALAKSVDTDARQPDNRRLACSPLARSASAANCASSFMDSSMVADIRPYVSTAYAVTE